MRPPLIVANWKMNMTIGEAHAFLAKFLPHLPEVSGVDIVLAPPYTALKFVSLSIDGKGVSLAAQNMHWEEGGAYTGEISPRLICDAGCRYVLLGHSERRRHCGETSFDVNRKVLAAFRNGLIPLLCVGEEARDRKEKKSQEVVESQLMKECAGVSPDQARALVVAYEPIWAIGTGEAATAEQIAEMHAFIRETLRRLFGAEAASSVRILYGGSVTPVNITGFAGVSEGVLVGGQSLSADVFLAIIRGMRQCISS